MEFAVTVAERKKAEENLSASETRYRRLFESAKDGILILDADTGQVVDVNPFLVSLLGYSHADFLGKSVWDLGPFKDVAVSRDVFRELQEKEYIRYEDLPLETRDGRLVNVDEGELNKVEAIIQSMTKRERREPVIIDGSRRTRIARGSGTTVSAVNQLLKQFNEMRKMMRQMSGGAMPAMPGGMGRMANMAAKAQAQRGESLPPGFEALGAGMKAGAPVRGGGGKNKKKKGGRVTPPKQR
jgi:PAS domain S-box-containing protein